MARDVLVTQHTQGRVREVVERSKHPRPVALSHPACVLARLSVAHSVHAVHRVVALLPPRSSSLFQNAWLPT